MGRPRGPFLKLLLSLTLAVNLLASFAHSSPLFAEICVGERIVFVPVEPSAEHEPCDLCLVACATALAPPDTGIGMGAAHSFFAYPVESGAAPPKRAPLNAQARSPPFFPV